MISNLTWIVALGLLATGAASALTIEGTVFVDLDGNGKQDKKEKGLAGVAVHDEDQVTLTDASGKYRLESKDAKANYVVISRSGENLGSAFFKPLDRTQPTMQADFALKPDPSGNPKDFRFIGVSDSHVLKAGCIRAKFLERILVNSGELAPRFFMNTGDPTHGPDNGAAQAFNQAVAAAKAPFVSTQGNGPYDPWYARNISPVRYSFECGGIRFISTGNHLQKPGEGPGSPLVWLESIMKTIPADAKLVAFNHEGQALMGELNANKGRVLAVIHGHGHKFADYQAHGVQHYITGIAAYYTMFSVYEVRDGKVTAENVELGGMDQWNDAPVDAKRWAEIREKYPPLPRSKTK